MIRGAAKNHSTCAVVVDPAALRRRAGRARQGGFTLTERRRLAGVAFAAHRLLRRGRGVLVRQRVRHRRGVRPLAGLHGRRLAAQGRRCATARTRTRAPPSTAPATTGWPTPSSCTARRCPTTTTSTPTRRGGPPGTSPSRAWRSSSTRTRAASRSAPTWPRRTARRTPATRSPPTAGVIAVNGEVTGRAGRADRRGVHRGGGRPRRSTPEALAVLTEKKNIRLLVCPQRAGRTRPSSAGSTAGCSCSRRTGCDAPGDDPRAGAQGGRAAPRRSCWPIWPSPGGPAVRSSPTRSCWPPAARPWASAWGRSTGSTPARLAVSRAGERAAGSVGGSDAFFPFPDGLQVLAEAGVKAIVRAGRLGPRPAGHRGGGEGRASRSTSPARATSSTDQPRVTRPLRVTRATEKRREHSNSRVTLYPPLRVSSHGVLYDHA